MLLLLHRNILHLHVLDRTTNITRIEFGPQNCIEQPDDKVINDIQNMICLPWKSYCIIKNPARIIGNDKHVFENQFGINQYKITEELINCEPFPLYPNEEIVGNVKNLITIEEGQLLKHEKVITIINTMIIQPLQFIVQALKVKALQDTIDCNGTPRVAGELWLIRNKTQYLPQINEQLLSLIDAHILTETQSIQLKATNDFIDIYGISHRIGEEWLVTETSPYHIIDVYEELVKEVELQIIERKSYCEILNPFDSVKKRNQIGKKMIRKGPCAFFLQPGEEMIAINPIYILQQNKALLFQASLPLKLTLPNKQLKKLKTGECCMIYGPGTFIPPVEGQICELRELILLGKTQGIYVRNNSTGQIKSIRGHAYMLSEDEYLYENSIILPELKPLLTKNSMPYDIITNYCPFNHAVQIYDFATKEIM